MINMGDAAMSEGPSYYYENRNLLLQTIMNQLSIKEEDLNRETSWIKAKIREANIDKVLEN
jgi:hypothetical protein